MSSGPDFVEDALFIGDPLVGAGDRFSNGVLGQDDDAVSVADDQVAGVDHDAADPDGERMSPG